MIKEKMNFFKLGQLKIKKKEEKQFILLGKISEKV